MFYWIYDLLRFCIDLSLISNVLAEIGLFKVILDPIAVEGVIRFMFLKKGIARTSLPFPLFWLEILSMYLIAVRASSPMPGKYFCKFLLG